MKNYIVNGEIVLWYEGGRREVVSLIPRSTWIAISSISAARECRFRMASSARQISSTRACCRHTRIRYKSLAIPAMSCDRSNCARHAAKASWVWLASRCSARDNLVQCIALRLWKPAVSSSYKIVLQNCRASLWVQSHHPTSFRHGRHKCTFIGQPIGVPAGTPPSPRRARCPRPAPRQLLLTRAGMREC
jgi:hypothetical protein